MLSYMVDKERDIIPFQITKFILFRERKLANGAVVDDGQRKRYHTSFVPEGLVQAQSYSVALDTLEFVIVNVSNVCNGNCIYCYEQGGSFGQQPGVMNKEAVDRVLDALRKYKNVGRLSFFGGKPANNFSIIEYLVDKTKGLVAAVFEYGEKFGR